MQVKKSRNQIMMPLLGCGGHKYTFLSDSIPKKGKNKNWQLWKNCEGKDFPEK